MFIELTPNLGLSENLCYLFQAELRQLPFILGNIAISTTITSIINVLRSYYYFDMILLIVTMSSNAPISLSSMATLDWSIAISSTKTNLT